MNYVVGGMAPWGYHAGNLVLHAANAVVFYAIARRLLAAGAGREPTGNGVAWGAAAAAVFAVHPLRVEPPRPPPLHRLEIAQHGQQEEQPAQHIAPLRYPGHRLVDPACMVCQNNLGNLLLDQDRLGESETAFRAAVTARPESAGPRNNLGSVLVRRGRFDEAAAPFREAMRLAPDRIGGALNLGLLSVIQGKYAEAIPLLRHVLAQRPDRPDAQATLATALVKCAEELRREGCPGEADSLGRESEALVQDRPGSR